MSVEGKLSNASIVRFINGFRDILSPLDEWRCIVRRTSACGDVADWKSYARIMRLARGDHGEWTRGKYTPIDSDKIELRESTLGVKPRGRAVLCKRFEIRARKVEINRKIGTVLINSELNGILLIPLQLIELTEERVFVYDGNVTLRKW